jgi:hypothetical protein
MAAAMAWIYLKQSAPLRPGMLANMEGDRTMTVAEMNEYMRGPISRTYGHSWRRVQGSDHPDGASVHYVEGRKKKEENPILYERGAGFKKWLRTLDGPAPDTFRIQLNVEGVRAHKAASDLLKIGVGGECIEWKEG